MEKTTWEALTALGNERKVLQKQSEDLTMQMKELTDEFLKKIQKLSDAQALIVQKMTAVEDSADRILKTCVIDTHA